MNLKIKEYVDCRDIKSLKYVFVDSLDVDPTFVHYEEEYNYCKNAGILEEHIDLTPFQMNQSEWNKAYWIRLKRDLLKNFSDERMSHMREVAQVFMAEKCERLRAEREKNANELVESKKSVKHDAAPAKLNQTDMHSTIIEVGEKYAGSKAQAQKMQEYKKQVENEYNQMSELEIQERDEREKRKAEYAEQSSINRNQDILSKKWVGIAVAVIVIIIVIIMLV